MDLQSATSALLRAHDVAQQLKLADHYIQAYNRMPSMFILPAEHANLRPLIESFASNADTFVEYLRALRDSLDGHARDEVHDLYRTVSVRVLQTSRRARLRRALDIILPEVEVANGGPLPYENQMRVMRCIEQTWGAMRMESMAKERSELTNKRLSSESRAVLLTEFWQMLDAELDAGRVLLGHKSVDDLLKAAHE